MAAVVEHCSRMGGVEEFKQSHLKGIVRLRIFFPFQTIAETCFHDNLQYYSILHKNSITLTNPRYRTSSSFLASPLVDKIRKENGTFPFRPLAYFLEQSRIRMVPTLCGSILCLTSRSRKDRYFPALCETYFCLRAFSIRSTGFKLGSRVVYQENF